MKSRLAAVLTLNRIVIFSKYTTVNWTALTLALRERVGVRD